MAKPSAAKGLNGSDRWSSVEPEDDREDRLNSLPDDVLLNVVERLDIPGATRAGILSGRWRRIPPMLSKMRLAVGSSDPERDRSKLSCGDDVVRANATIAEAIRIMLENRSTGLYTVRLLCLQFFLGYGDIGVGQAVADTITTKNIGLAELALLTRKDGRRCADQDLVAYGGQMRSFVDACPHTLFSGLAQLKLENLRLPESDFESDFPKILGICERLEFLRLYNCDAGIKSSLRVEHQQLRGLEIINSGFERVDLNWLPELTTLTFSSWKSHHDPMAFGHVPLLHTVTMSNTAASCHKMLRLSELLGMATISNLHLNFESEKIWVKPEGPIQLSQVFDKLNFVNLADISEECDLTWTLFVLRGAPNLEELCVSVWNRCDLVRGEKDRKKLQLSEERKDAGTEWESSASDFKHHNLARAQDLWVSVARQVCELRQWRHGIDG